jgi:hypothetical protein
MKSNAFSGKHLDIFEFYFMVSNEFGLNINLILYFLFNNFNLLLLYFTTRRLRNNLHR